MKRFTALILLVVLAFSLFACGTTNNSRPNELSIDNPALEEVLADIAKDFDSTSRKLTAKLDEIRTSVGNTYEEYSKNASLIEGYYELCIEEANKLYERTNGNAIKYYKAVATSVDHNDKDVLIGATDWFYERVYEDALESFCDAIYDGSYDNLCDTYYDGVIKDARNSMDYEDWSDIRSAFYENWLNARSEFYEDWLDARSDVYEIYLVIKSAFIYDGNFDVEGILNSDSKEENSAENTSTESTNDESEPSYVVDYSDAESFESALDNDTKVKGKIVQFFVKEYVPDSVLGINCHAGEHLNFIFATKLDVKKGDTIVVRITEDPSKIFLVDSWEVPCEFIELVKSEGGPAELTEIALTMGALDFKGMNYKDAEQKFREMGFSNFEYKTVDTENETLADTICYIDIREFIFGDSDFKKGDKYDADATVIFYTYKYEKPEPVYYSTNDYETAKKGNTGVFAYVREGKLYDIYYIIDFDEGYVYYFLEGEGNDFCDKLKIDFGDLNTYVSFTYHDGDDVWSERLHFKYENVPTILIWNDADGFPYEYTPTNLEEALLLRNTKKTKER